MIGIGVRESNSGKKYNVIYNANEIAQNIAIKYNVKGWKA